MRYSFYLLLVSILSSACVSNIYLVRHAERLDESRESSLSEQGLAHADALKEVLKKEDIDVVYSSIYLRCRQTAQPLVHTIGQEMQLYSPDTTKGLLPVLRSQKNKNVLVVGHSDNVPWLIRQLTGDSLYIAHTQYGDLFQIRLTRGVFGERKELIRRRY